MYTSSDPFNVTVIISKTITFFEKIFFLYNFKLLKINIFLARYLFLFLILKDNLFFNFLLQSKIYFGILTSVKFEFRRRVDYDL